MIKDITNQRFGRLVAIERIPNKKPGYSCYHWLCQCDCGNTKEVSLSHLSNKRLRTVSCGCWRGMKESSDKNKSGFNKVLRSYKFSAKYKHLNFELTDYEFRQLTSQNCHYCGRPPEKLSKRSKNTLGHYYYNGIDRKNNKEGYKLDNCVSCCEKCNFFKGDMDYEDFISLIKTIAINLGVK